MNNMFSVRDLLDTDLLQRIQDDFSNIADVASIIYDLEGIPLTKPSNFSDYCKLIRSTPKGLKNCMNSDVELAKAVNGDEGAALVCMSGRLMDGIAPIIVEGQQIAGWGMGQVLFEDLDEDWIRWYALDIGVSENELVAGYNKLKHRGKDDFLKNIKYLMTLSREISEIALANYQLKAEIKNRRKSEERYRSIVNNAFVGICEISNDGKLEYVNDQMSILSGFSRDELIGMNSKQLLESQRDFKAYFQGISNYYANKDINRAGYDFYAHIYHKKGSKKIPCRVCMTPQKNLSNNIIKTSAVIIDISSERKALRELERRNRELYESKKQIDLFFDNNINGLCIFDSLLKKVKCNNAYMQVFEEEELYYPFDNSVLQKVLNGEVVEVEEKKESGVQLYSVKASPIYDYNGNISQVLITVRDITDYQLMIENILFTEKMKGIGMLASGIAHDMRGIFMVLGNSNHTLKQIIGSLDSGQYQNNLEKILQVQESGLVNGRKLLTQLISFPGNTNIRKERFLLKETIEKIMRIYNSKILDKNAEMIVDIQRAVTIESWESKFIQIIMNLFSNALDAISQSGKIHITDECSNGRFYLVIADDGIGIKSNEVNMIFKAFYSMKANGTGLGLFSVKNLVEELGGAIYVESENKKGSRFIITIEDNSQVKTNIQE